MTACGLTYMTAKPSPSLNVQSSLGSPFSRKVVLHLSLGRQLGIFSFKGSVTHDKEICNFVHCIYRAQNLLQNMLSYDQGHPTRI